MKIAFLCTSRAMGGLELNCLRLCSWLQQAGHEPMLFCPRDSRLAENAAQRNIKTIHFKRHSKHIAFDSVFRLIRLLREEHIRMVVIAHYHHFYLGVWAKLFSARNLRLIYWQQMQVSLKRKDPYHSFFYKHIDAWICPLHVLKEQLLSNTPLAAEKIHVIPLGIDLDIFRDAAIKKNESRILLNLPAHDFLAGTIGRIDPMKGQETVLRALRIVIDNGVGVKALFIGEETSPGYLDKLQSIVSELGLENEVIIRPFTHDVVHAFASLDVFVMASLSEPIGMVTIEAMAAGIPVIGTNQGGTPELLGNGSSGLLYAPGYAEELAANLLSIYRDEDLRRSLVSRALERSRLYGHDVQCAGWEAVLTQLT